MDDKIEKRIMIYSSMRRAWSALTKKSEVQGWMELGRTIYLDLQVGGGLRFFNDQVTGKFTEIYAPNILEFTWRRTGWDPEWPDSLVRFELEDLGGQVDLRMTHSGLPNEEERIEQEEDWDLYFLEPMKEWAETDFKGALYGVLPLRKVDPSTPKPKED